MSKTVSHNISAALGLRLGFYAGSGLTHSDQTPDQHKHKPVTISADRTVVLAANNAVPLGSIVLTEVSDGHSAKVTVELGPVIRFNKATATTFAEGDFGKGVLSDGAGGVKPAGTASGLGKVTSVEGDMVFVLTYGDRPATT